MTQMRGANSLLDDVIRACGQGLAENQPDDEKDFFVQFLPVPRHLRVLDPQVRIVIGDKGAGKTQLFRALKFPNGRELLADIARRHGHRILPLDRTNWRVGFEASGSNFPAPDVLDTFARGRKVEDLRLIWLALLTSVLVKAGDLRGTEIPPSLMRLLSRPDWPLSDLLAEMSRSEPQGGLFASLDSLDSELATRDRHVVVTYDELDRVSPGDWNIIRTALQGLVQFWAIYSRRWKRVQPKIFLRRDLYEHAALRGPDVAKVAWNSAELLWSSGELYALLFKRLANSSEELREYLMKMRLKIADEGLLGWNPAWRDEEGFGSVVRNVFGEHMGPDPRKGLTLRWIPNHLKDGHGRLFPRPLLRLIDEAATLEKREQKAEKPCLFHHADLRLALDRVSEFRVEELAQEEFQWMRKVREAFAAKPFQVPAARREVLRSLQISWKTTEAKPPETDPERLLNYLIELGIASVRLDGRIDIGDLYLKGLHLRRKGGVARPRPAGAAD